MSESSQSVAPRRQTTEPKSEGYVLPQWAINIIRMCLHILSLVFWRVSYRGTEHIPQHSISLLESQQIAMFGRKL